MIPSPLRRWGPAPRSSGDVYAPLSPAGAACGFGRPQHFYCTDRQLDQFTVFDAAGGGHLTTDQDLSCTGTSPSRGPAGGRPCPALWKAPFQGRPSAHVRAGIFPVTIPTTVVSANQTASSAPATDEGVLYRVQKRPDAHPDRRLPGPGNAPATFVVLGEKSTLFLSGAGPFYLYVYGQGPDKECTVKAPSGAVICGSLQGVTLDFTESSPGGSFELTLQAMQPTRIEYQTPAAPDTAATSGGSWARAGLSVLIFSRKEAASSKKQQSGASLWSWWPPWWCSPSRRWCWRS